jgi:hypothetical protein
LLSPSVQLFCLPENSTLFLVKNGRTKQKSSPQEGSWPFFDEKNPSGLHEITIVFIKQELLPQNDAERVPRQRPLLYCPLPHILVTIEK